MHTRLHLGLPALLCAVLLQACHEPDKPAPAPTCRAYWVWHENLDFHALHPDSTITVDGRAYLLSDIRFVLSEFQMVSEDGQAINCPVRWAVANFFRGPNFLDLGLMPPGRYKAVRFRLGATADVLGSIPANSPRGYPLASEGLCAADDRWLALRMRGSENGQDIDWQLPASATGQWVEVPAVDVFTVKDGFAFSIHTVIDWAEVVRQLSDKTSGLLPADQANALAQTWQQGSFAQVDHGHADPTVQ